MAIRVLEETGLLPHLNPGVLTWRDFQRLKPVAPSMGMMLETTAARLFTERGGPHYGSPDKDPAVRLRVLEDAGRCSVPFTTGILIGIGETRAERAESLFAIRQIAREYGGIQEVIVQNFRAKPDTKMRGVPDAELADLAATIAVARLVLGPAARVQAPPNLIGDQYGLILAAGIDDWGGVSPLTPDHVNPERPWPQIEELAAPDPGRGDASRGTAHDLPRIPARAVARPAAGRARGGARRPGDRPRPRGRDPARPALAGARRRLGRGFRPHGPARDDRQRRAGPATAATTSPRCTATGTRWPPGSTRRRAGGVPTVPRSGCGPTWPRPCARPKPIPAGISDAQALALLDADGPELDALAALADGLRRDVAGDDITYVVTRNINFTNVCYTGCRFCAFAQRRTDADAYTLSLSQVGDRAEEAWEAGATEVCMQGGIHPDLPGTAYFDLAAEVRRRCPEIHVHAFSPMEVSNGCRPHRPAGAGVARSAPASPGSARCPAPRPRSSTTTCAGCSPRASCPPRPGSR